MMIELLLLWQPIHSCDLCSEPDFPFLRPIWYVFPMIYSQLVLLTGLNSTKI